MTQHYKFFQNNKCEFFPCHTINDNNRETFNCLFCYCPLYVLGEDCGGEFTYTKLHIKDCSQCTIPHSKNGYEHIMKNAIKIVELMKKINDW